MEQVLDIEVSEGLVPAGTIPDVRIPLPDPCLTVSFASQNYANSYVGHAKINRLMFIAERTADAQLALSALKIAADELKKVLQCLEEGQLCCGVLHAGWFVTLLSPAAGAEHAEIPRCHQQDQQPCRPGVPVRQVGYSQACSATCISCPVHISLAG